MGAIAEVTFAGPPLYGFTLEGAIAAAMESDPKVALGYLHSCVRRDGGQVVGGVRAASLCYTAGESLDLFGGGDLGGLDGCSWYDVPCKAKEAANALAAKAKAAAAAIASTVKGGAQAVARAATTASKAVAQATTVIVRKAQQAGAYVADAAKAAGKAIVEGAKAAGRAVVRVGKVIASSKLAREAISWALAMAVEAALCATGVLAFLCSPTSVSALQAGLSIAVNAGLDAALGKPVDWASMAIGLLTALIGFVIPGASTSIVAPPREIATALSSAFASGSKQAIVDTVLVVIKSIGPMITNLIRAGKADLKGEKVVQAQKAAAAFARTDPVKLANATATKAIETKVDPITKAAVATLNEADRRLAKVKEVLPPAIVAAERRAAVQSGVLTASPNASDRAQAHKPAGGSVFAMGLLGVGGFLVGGPVGAAAGVAIGARA